MKKINNKGVTLVELIVSFALVGVAIIYFFQTLYTVKKVYADARLETNYYIRKEQDVDKGVRKAAEFVFNMLRYQVVKYFGLFNVLYKNFEAANRCVNIDEISGIEALLLRLEYSADTLLGRRASDIGASFKVVEYYDTKESHPDETELIERLYGQLDDFEKFNVSKIEDIL